MSQQIKAFAAAYLAKAGCSTRTTGVEAIRSTFTVRAVVATVEEVNLAKVAAEAFKAKFGWDMTVELKVTVKAAAVPVAAIG